MHRFLKSLFFGLSLFIVFTILFKFNYTSNRPYFDLKSLECYNNDEHSRRILRGVKDNISFIKSFSAPDIKIGIGRINVRGQLYYEGNKLRLVIKSFLAKEMDIGSNESMFWFWSKRMRPQALYYSTHEDVYRTNLRPIFNRDWLLDCFIFSRIQDYDGKITFFKKDNILVKKQLKKVSEHEHVYLITLIDIDKLVIVEKYICDLDEQVMACIEYKDFDSNHIPRSIKVYWQEEDISMDWEIIDMKINTPINEDVWLVPNYTPKVRMDKN